MHDNIFVKIWKSSTDFSYYRNLYNKKLSVSLLFLLIVILFYSVVLGIGLWTKFLLLYFDDYKNILAEIPVLEYNQGILKTENDNDYIYEKDDFYFSVQPKIVIKDNIKNIDKENIILIRKDGYIIKSIYSEVYKSKYDKAIFNFVLDPNEILGLSRYIKFLGYLVIMFFIFFISLLYCLFNIIIFSVVMHLVSMLNKLRLEYKQILVLCVYAITPALFYSLIITLLGFSAPFLFIYVFFLTFILLHLKRHLGLMKIKS